MIYVLKTKPRTKGQSDLVKRPKTRVKLVKIGPKAGTGVKFGFGFDPVFKTMGMRFFFFFKCHNFPFINGSIL